MNIYDGFAKLWILLIPISSVVISQEIPGLTFSNILAILSIFIPITLKNTKYFKILFSVVFIFVFYEVVSQILILGNGYDLNNSGMKLISSDLNLEIFRSSLYTQSVYLLCGFLTFLFFYFYYSNRFDKALLYSALLLCLYGIYEFLYFLVYKENGDFLSNRIFGNVEYINSSFFQPIEIGIYTVNKMKSLTGEPSMFAFTMFPYLIFANYKKEISISLLFVFCILMSLCSTMILGLIIIIMYNYKNIIKFSIKPINIIIIIIIMLILLNTDLLNKLILDKFTTENVSTGERFNLFISNLEFFGNASLSNKIFGFGFGLSRSTDLFSTLLVNIGLFGALIFCLIYAYPLFKLKNSNLNNCLRLILILNFTIMMVSVSEFAYLPSWMFLGIAYRCINVNRGST